MNRSQELVLTYAAMPELQSVSFSVLAKHGRVYMQDAKLKGAHNQQCFMNAYQYAERHDLFYVEGYAMPNGLIPLSHAWCVDKEGVIHDPTWDHADDYFGVPFYLDTVQEILQETGYYGIFDNLYMLRGRTVEEVTKLLTEGVIT